jgi:hypothetical protein
MGTGNDKFYFYISVSWLKYILKLVFFVIIPYNVIMLSLGYFSIIPAPIACNLGLFGTFVITFVCSFIRKRRIAGKDK